MSLIKKLAIPLVCAKMVKGQDSAYLQQQVMSQKYSTSITRVQDKLDEARDKVKSQKRELEKKDEDLKKKDQALKKKDEDLDQAYCDLDKCDDNFKKCDADSKQSDADLAEAHCDLKQCDENSKKLEDDLCCVKDELEEIKTAFAEKEVELEKVKAKFEECEARTLAPTSASPTASPTAKTAAPSLSPTAVPTAVPTASPEVCIKNVVKRSAQEFAVFKIGCVEDGVDAVKFHCDEVDKPRRMEWTKKDCQEALGVTSDADGILDPTIYHCECIADDMRVVEQIPE